MAGDNPNRYCICITDKPQDTNSKAAVLDEVRWGSGAVIRVKFLEGDESLRERVRAVAEQWTAPGLANVSLQFVDSGQADVRIAFKQGDGSWSTLGMQCRDVQDPE